MSCAGGSGATWRAWGALQ